MVSRAELRTCQAKAMSEAQLLNAVRTLARSLGWRTYHTHRSEGSEPGFPDLVLVRGPAILWRELKTETGVLNQAQRGWLADLEAAGQDVDVWRPVDYLEGRVADALQARTRLASGAPR